jgi:rhamnogalacturonyl hydrolase YesR
MEQLAELSGDKRYDDYATNFCDFHLNGIPFVTYQVKTLNADSSANNQIINTNLLDFTLAPSLPLIYKLRKNKQFSNRDEYKVFVDRMLKYARKGQLRLPGLNIYTRTTPQKYTTWADDMFMGIPFLVQASQYANDAKTRDFFIEDAASQVIAFSSQVWDADAQLYMHAHFSGTTQKFPHWSRANGWAIWAMSEVLMNLPKSNPKYTIILNQYKTLVASLVKYQTPDGFWLNVLDRPDSKPEVSGTAIFTMGIARGVTNGWLDEQTFKPIVMKGWSALKTQISPDGTVHNICMGTMCSPDVNYYLNRPFYDNDTHGIFAVLFAGIEVDKMMKRYLISEADAR